MLNKLAFLTFIISVLLLTSCQTTEQTTTQNNVAKNQSADSAPFIPTWMYSDNNLKADSTKFSVTIMVANADSLRTLEITKSQARSLLEHKLSEISEDQRIKVSQNNPSAAETDFIFQLRMAEQAIANGAKVTKMKVKKDENQYIGFAKIEIQKSSISSNLKSYFSDQSTKYSGLIDSFDFTQIE